jgi:hypothetical protein
MGGNSEDKRRQEEARRRDADDRARYLTFLEGANKPTLQQQREDTRYGEWDDFMRDPQHDFSKPPTSAGLVYSNIFRPAIANRMAERTATGATQMGSFGANPNLMALVKQHRADQMAESGAIEQAEALRMKDAEMRGSALPWASLAQNRTMGLAGLTGNQSQFSQNQYMTFKPRPSPWWGVLSAGLGGLSSVLTGGFSEGGAWAH